MTKNLPGRGRAWIELDRAALEQNTAALTALLPPGCRLMPAVKADAYGHGAELLVPALEELGVTDFCVASAAEGAELRRFGAKGKLLVLGYTGPEDLDLVADYDLIQAVVDADYAELLARRGQPLRVHLKLDTGMHRLGERPENLPRLAAALRGSCLRVEGVFTHLCADDPRQGSGRALTEAQISVFHAAVRELEALGVPCGEQHMMASCGLLRCPWPEGAYARVGLALYGAWEDAEDGASPAALRPVMTLKARVALVKDLLPGESCGYGPDYVAKERRKIALLSIGYADGLPRSLSNGVGSVLLHGKAAPILGRVCMDQTAVDVTEISETAQGDDAVVIGRSGELENSACTLARLAGTIPNELLSCLGTRLPRLWAET